jgi:uncharacterized protein with HEPN domain
MPRDKASIHDVVASMRLAITYVQGRSFEEFANDMECVDAVVRRLEVIGEAVKRLSTPLREQHPDIPWQKMAGMRDRLIHGYDDVNLEYVYEVVVKTIPVILPELDKILPNLSEPI